MAPRACLLACFHTLLSHTVSLMQSLVPEKQTGCPGGIWAVLWLWKISSSYLRSREDSGMQLKHGWVIGVCPCMWLYMAVCQNLSCLESSNTLAISTTLYPTPCHQQEKLWRVWLLCANRTDCQRLRCVSLLIKESTLPVCGISLFPYWMLYSNSRSLLSSLLHNVVL